MTAAGLAARVAELEMWLAEAHIRIAELEAGEEFRTFKWADGTAYADEYAWMSEIDGYAEAIMEGDQPADVIEEVWVLKERKVHTLKPPGWDELQKELAEERLEEAERRANAEEAAERRDG